MNQYRVMYRGVIGIMEDYVEAESEYEAIKKVIGNKPHATKVKVEKVFKPSTSDYYNIKGLLYLSLIIGAIGWGLAMWVTLK